MNRRAFFRLAASTLAVAQTSLTRAQDAFPVRPLRLVVPLSAGGPSDQLARAVAQELAADLGQPVVVENRPGADGAVAMRDVAAAAADGHTMLYTVASMLATPMLAPAAGLDWKAYTPVGRLGRLTFCMMVSAQLPVRTVAEFIAYAKANPDALSYATSTNSELMAASRLIQVAGIRMTRVPYKGGAQAMPDLVAGRVQVMFGPASLAVAQQAAGGLRVLATLLPERSPALPDVPTMAEAGFPAVSVPTWQALFVPAATPRAAIDRLAAGVNRVMARPDVRANLERRAIFVERADPQELAATVRQELVSWRRLVDEFQLAAN